MNTPLTESDLSLTEKQSLFLDQVREGKNIFLTGKAGTGKSFIIRRATEILKEAGRPFVAVAPTGIAANNIEGQTIHSLFKLPPFGVLDFESCNFVTPEIKRVLKKAGTIIFDEVSMLRPDIFDAVHWTLIKNGLAGLDKRQVILVGDLKQLPPILDDNARSVLYRTYDGDTFDCAKIYERLQVSVIELDEIRRQSDPRFIEALNVIREGGKHEYFRQFLGQEPRGIILAPHNATVLAYNEAGLAAQQGELFTFTATLEGSARIEDFSLEAEIRVKNGCKIMYLANSQNNPLRNGTLGTFISRDGVHFIKVGSVEYALEQITITKKQYIHNKKTDALELKEVGNITQYPFKLAYALSIHKSQGLTFDECTVDLRRPCFQKGQMYVALSRVRTPDGLRIIA